MKVKSTIVLTEAVIINIIRKQFANIDVQLETVNLHTTFSKSGDLTVNAECTYEVDLGDENQY